MSKSGLADSPFFLPQAKKEAVSSVPSSKPEKSTIEENVSPVPHSPTLDKMNTIIPQAQNEESQDQKRSNDRTFERPNERSTERLTERTVKQKREKIRHTFDIYKDQLISLQMIQLEKVQAGRRKPKLGKMVADGIDLFIKQAASKKKQA